MGEKSFKLSSNGYRLEGLKKMIEEELVPFLADKGLIKPDFEEVGLLLYEMYAGETEKFDDLTRRTMETIKDAEALLKSLSKADIIAKQHYKDESSSL